MIDLIIYLSDVRLGDDGETAVVLSIEMVMIKELPKHTIFDPHVAISTAASSIVMLANSMWSKLVVRRFTVIDCGERQLGLLSTVVGLIIEAAGIPLVSSPLGRTFFIATPFSGFAASFFHKQVDALDVSGHLNPPLPLSTRQSKRCPD